MDVVEVIDKKIGEVRTESLDISIGELVSLHENKELIIRPDFQRLFRWSTEQRSRLIESMLLELPIPSIFVIEREDGVFELIDGLQRTSSLIQFVSANAIQLDPLVLEGCDLVPELNGARFDDLPLTLRLRLKRSSLRTVVIKRQSSQFLRYEMFKRLNTGGTKLSEQDIRNVNARMIGDVGTAFYDFIEQCSEDVNFLGCTELLSAAAVEARAREELVLRFFAVKNFRQGFKGSITDWLDHFMETILIEGAPFDFVAERAVFDGTFELLNEKFGPYAFVKYRAGKPMGGVAPAYFEAVTMGAYENSLALSALSNDEAVARLSAAVASDPFRAATGPGANSLPKLNQRIELIRQAFE
ncbi:DUF262 domain-containing protein [Stenotrophomonas sp. PS02289]|uniref:DUF262 domain-containing protein n=1 Tax=Stenotrophomonas sp. PS02289 TaxID=2991422 RepID=UPI00249BB0AF|nr:DUF262 domain-containing protein [Stenotrophomonas sp. PS02289]